MRIRPVILTFLAAAAIFGWLHRHPSIADSDAWYHLKMAELTAASGPVREFPWLPFTTLSDAFADHHFLYHVILAGFVSAFGPLVGGKVATALFGAAVVTALHALLRDRGVRHAWAWAFLPFAAQGALFRMTLIKGVAPALALLFVALILLRRSGGAWHRSGAGHLWGLFLLSWVSVWLYGGWPILPVVVAAWMSGIVIESRLSGVTLLQRCKRVAAAVAGGLLAGLVINPFFPANLAFYREQIVRIALQGRTDPSVAVGLEWYPLDPTHLFLGSAAVFIALAAAIALLAAVIAWKGVAKPGAKVAPERAGDLVTALVLTLGFFLLTLRQARHQEYLIPFLTFFTALLFDTVARLTDFGSLGAAIGKRLSSVTPLLRSKGVRVAVIGATVIAGIGTLCVRNLLEIDRVMTTRPAFTKYSGAGAWLKENVPEGEVVFNTRWDEFPLLFFHDGRHRHIAGLDARFLSAKDPERYWLWRDISEGRRRLGLAALMKEGFGAEIVFLRLEDEPLLPLIRKDPSFERVYADSEAEIWRVRSTTMQGRPASP